MKKNLIIIIFIIIFGGCLENKENKKVIERDYKKILAIKNDIIKNSEIIINDLNRLKSKILDDDINIIEESLNEFKGSNRNFIYAYYGDINGDFTVFPKITLPKDYDPRKRGWFIKAVETEKIVVASGIDNENEQYRYYLSDIIKYSNKIIGVIGLETSFSINIPNIEYRYPIFYEKRAFAVINNDNMIIYDSDEKNRYINIQKYFNKDILEEIKKADYSIKTKIVGRYKNIISFTKVNFLDETLILLSYNKYKL